MAKKDFFVIKTSVTSKGDCINRGDKATLDEKAEEKLIALGNIELYDPEKHDAIGNAKLALETKVQELTNKVAELEAELAEAKKGK